MGFELSLEKKFNQKKIYEFIKKKNPRLHIFI